MPLHRRQPVVHVLIVDDNELLAEMLRSLLDDEPDVVVLGVATSLTGALDALSIAIPEVILLDEYLPEGPAAETAHVIHAAAPSAELVLWTATSAPLEATPRLAATLTKGATYDEVVGTIRGLGRPKRTRADEPVSRPSQLTDH